MDYAIGQCWDSLRELMDAHAALGLKASVCMPDWLPADELIRDFFAMSRAEEARFAVLYEKSKAAFAPLSDPLGTDFSGHRQLVSGREEVYSDWFAWVLETVGDPMLMGRILGSNRFADVRKAEVIREERANEIVIRAGEKKLAVIEIHTGKHRPFEGAEPDGEERIFLGVHPPETDFAETDFAETDFAETDFGFLSWASVCVALRRIAADRLDAERTVSTAFILAFVGAVEQNLLGFAWPATAHGKVPRMASHLSKFLQAEEKMEKQQTAVTDEIKNFLQTGLRTYAPGCLALAEFRRQVLSRMQSVLDESSEAFTALGLPVSNLRPVDQKLDDPDIDKTSWQIAFKTNHGDGLYSGYSVVCQLEETPDQQIWVEAWIYFGKKTDRDQLFRALKQVPSEAGFFLEQFSDGTPQMICYGNPESFCQISETFRGLVQQWLRVLKSAGGITPYLTEQEELALSAAT